ncbi:MAG: preprotein translocase subunit SecG [Paracoccaceae bacterium]|jgi:preprotein translocase subunit SecG|nr:preprotein translocase subunit SecG [Paracoccaceae bacterium]
MENVVLTIHLILALLLIGIVLLQRSEGGGLLGGGGGGGGGVMSGRAAANAMTKLTWIFAAAFIATSITLTVISAQKSQGNSVVDQDLTDSRTEVPADLVPSLPDTNLLPPTPSDAPATPPPAE